MIIETKLHIPETTGHLINRSHLFKRLDQNLHKKMTLIVAPAGYGKSTLLSEWTKTLHINTSWVSLDINDNDPVRFWSHLIKSLNQSYPLFAELNEHEQLDANDPSLMTKLVNRLNRLSEKVIIIWDDFHTVTNENILLQVSYFLERLPSSVHICLASRTYPKIPLSRMRVHDDVAELKMEDLQFNKREITDFFKYCTNLSISQHDMTTILQKTEGWITGVRLIALSINDDKYGSAQNFFTEMTGEHYIISDYFFEEVFINQTEETQNLLLKTSILDRIHIDLVRIFSENKSNIEQINLDNLFLISLDNNRKWYRYHHLFQDFLKRKLKETLPNDISRLYHVAGKWYEGNHFYHEAINYYITCEHYEEAISLLENLAPNMIHTNLNELRHWFDKIPDELLLEKQHLLMYNIFTLQMMGETKKSNLKLKKSLDVVTDPSVRSGLEMLSVMGALFASDFELFIQLSEEYIKKYPDADDFMSLGTEGDLEIPKWSFLETVGNLQEKELLLSRMLDSWSKSKYYYFIASLNMAYSELMMEWNRLEEAKYYIMEAQRIGVENQNKLMIVSTYIFLIKLYILEGNIEKVKELRDRLDKEVNRQDFPKLYQFIQIYQTYFAIFVGETEQAFHWLETCELAITDEIPITMVMEYTLFAKLLGKKGNKQEAISLITRILKVIRQNEMHTNTIQLLLEYSILLAEEGDMKSSIDALEEALFLGEKNHYKLVFVEAGKALLPLLHYYLVLRKKEQRQVLHSVRISYVKEIIKITNNIFQLNMYTKIENEESIYLTEKETVVIQLLTTSLTNKEIAQDLDISLSTVKTHINSLYRKLNASNRMEAIERAKFLNLL